MSDHQHHELVLPDLGLGDIPITASVWLVDPGQEVIKGDRLLEVAAGNVTVDLPAPASGILAETFVAEDDRLSVGQVLGLIVCAPECDAVA